MASVRLIVLAAASAIAGVGCASKPAAEVSKNEMTTVRDSHASAKIGDSKAKVLDSFKAGNKVKLGSSNVGGATIEEWKVEAFRDEDNRKDLFVTFLYFCDDRFVDSSDTRIDFRSNQTIVDRWKHSGSK
jgi:hypothetical protein